MDLLAHAASLLANADAPAAVLQALALSRLTALSKPGGGVRGIATGDTLRRLVSRALARQHVVFFFLLAPFCIRRSQGRVGRVHGSPSRARGRDLGPAGQTAWCRDLALAPAGVSQELVQGWGCASSTGLKRDGELEEGSRKRALRSDGNDATPPEDPSSLGRSPQRGGGADSPPNEQGGARRWQLQSPSAPRL